MRWLRGWVSADVVRDEFEQLQNPNTLLSACITHTDDVKKTTFHDNVKDLKRKRVLKPIIIIVTLIFLSVSSATAVTRPYLIQLLKAYGIPTDATLTASVICSIALSGTCCFLLSVKKIGKRRLYLISGTILVLCCFGLSKIIEKYQKKLFVKIIIR